MNDEESKEAESRLASEKPAPAPVQAQRKSAFVTIIGRPSSGKSTLMNVFCGEKVSIVSPAPQTTRNRIRGIVTRPEGQLVFLDTPGYHKSEKKLNLHLKGLAEQSLDDADLILYVADTSREPGPEEETIVSFLFPRSRKVLAALNKVDVKSSDPTHFRAFIEEKLGKIECHEIEAINRIGTDKLLAALFAAAPTGPQYYPEEFYTDQEPEFRITEIIREKAMLKTRDELPHAIYVEIADSKMDAEKNELSVRAFLIVERDSQKGIVIGKGAQVIKAIRLEAEKDLNDIFPYAIHLDLQVKVRKNWRQNDAVLKRLLF
jgi:GTP-binding protein Era